MKGPQRGNWLIGGEQAKVLLPSNRARYISMYLLFLLVLSALAGLLVLIVPGASPTAYHLEASTYSGISTVLIAFALLGHIAYPASRFSRRFGQILILAVVAASGVASIQRLSSIINLEADWLLFLQRQGAIYSGVSDTLSPVVPIGFFLAACGTLLILCGRVWMGQSLFLFILFIALLPFTGYIYGARTIVRACPVISMPLAAAAALSLLGLAALSATSHSGWMRPLSSRLPGGMGARRLIPVVILVPLLIGWLGIAAHRHGDVPIELAVGFMMGSVIFLLGGAVWWNALQICRTENERELISEQLRSSEARYRAIVEHVPYGTWTSDASGRCTYVAGSLLDMLGTDFSRVRDFGWLLFIHDDDLEPYVAKWQRCIRTGVDFEYEYRVRAASDSWVTLLTKGRPVRDAQGGISGWVGIHLDVTARREAEQALCESEASFRTTFDNAAVGIAVTDLRGEVIRCNQRLGDILEYQCDELIGKNILDMTLPEFVVDEQKLLHQLLNGDTAVMRLEKRCYAKSGRPVWVLTTTSMQSSNHGDGPMCVTIVQNIEKRRRAEDHRDLLVRELNHRVKNLLVTVTSIASQTMRGSSSMEDFRRAFYGRIRALSTAHDLLTQSDWQGAEMSEIISRTVEMYGMKGRVGASGSVIILKPRPALAAAMIVHELCTNAAKYGSLKKENGSVKVSWSVRGEKNRKRLRVIWLEEGGEPVIAPKSEGFGVNMIRRTVTLELGGKVQISYRRSGLKCTLECPVSEELLEVEGANG